MDAARKEHHGSARAHKTELPIGWHEGLSPDCNPYLRCAIIPLFRTGVTPNLIYAQCGFKSEVIFAHHPPPFAIEPALRGRFGGFARLENGGLGLRRHYRQAGK